ncbi:hypothetical protein EE612_016598, partial [Oryza sativa]
PVRTASPPASRLHRHRLTPLLPPPTAGAGSPSSAAGAGSASHLLPPAPAAAVAGSRGDRRAMDGRNPSERSVFRLQREAVGRQPKLGRLQHYP